MPILYRVSFSLFHCIYYNINIIFILVSLLKNNIRQCKNTRKSISLATYPHTSSHNHAISTPIIYSYRCTLSLIITNSNLCIHVRINNIQWALCTYKTMPHISSMKTDEITYNSVGMAGKVMMVLAVFLSVRSKLVLSCKQKTGFTENEQTEDRCIICVEKKTSISS